MFAMLRIFYFISFLGSTYLHALSVFLLDGISFPYGCVETLQKLGFCLSCRLPISPAFHLFFIL